jgi:hypothetical protein
MSGSMSEYIALENFSDIRQSTPSKDKDTLLKSSSTIFIRTLEEYTKHGRDSSFASITAFTGSGAAELRSDLYPADKSRITIPVLDGWNLDANGLCVENAPAGHDTWIYEHGSISKDRIELLLHDANYNSIPDRAKDLVTHLRKKIDHAV